ncbi:MAG: mechanosensitive ion channel [Clostridia bacterium]|nr:mechanosensitive ion channel [Clostridia bacterium]
METIWAFLEKPFMRELMTVLLTLACLFAAFRVVNHLLKRLPKSRLAAHIGPSATSFLKSFAGFALKAMLVIIAAGVVGVPTSSLVALLGSVGLAIGLAMQGSLSNFAGGMMVLLFKPFEVGDVIEEPGGETGTVTDVSMFYTTIRTRDNRCVVLPNGNLSNGRVINYSAEPYLRQDLEYIVAYGTDVEKVRRILLDAAQKNARVLSDPAPAMVLSRMEDSALVCLLLVYCKVEDYASVPGEMNEAVKAAFEKEGVSIPFPQLDVHIAQ